MAKINILLLTELLNQGKTQIEIAKILNVTQAAISWNRRYKLKLPPAIAPTKLFPEEVKKLYEAGMSQQQLSEKYGLPSGNVSAFMKRHSIKVRPKEIRQLRGKQHPLWTKNPTYAACHQRIQNLRGSPSKCETCGTSDSNKRYADPTDYKRLCVSCHRKFDRLLTIPIDAIIKLRNEGQTQEQIASRFACTRGTISRRLRQVGLFGRV